MFFPVLVFFLNSYFPFIDDDFKLGISYLSALPSTVSASVVMVSIAGGNLPGAIFNASISSLLGVILTPAWMGILSGEIQGEIDFWSSLGDLSLKVLFPVFLGILSHGWIYPKLKKILPKLKFVDQSVIMMIVFTSFSESFAQKIDNNLRQKNVYYDDLNTGNILQPLKISCLQKNSFINYMKSQGKLGGQNKVPRLSNDRKIADELTNYIQH